MVRVVGNLPKSIDVSGINLDKVLVLMFKDSDPEIDICGVDPRIVYIITNRSREQMKGYYDAGFYSVYTDVDYGDLTYDMIYEFLMVDYDLNTQMYKSSRLHDLYVNKLSLFDAILTILTSIRNKDAATLYSTVKYNLNDAIAGLQDIKNIVEFSQDVTGIQVKFHALEAKVAELMENAKTANPEAMQLAQSQIEQLQQALDKKQQEIAILTSDNKELNDKVNSLQVAGADVVPASKFNQLMADKQLVDHQLSVARTEKANLEQRLAAVNKVQAMSQPTDAFSQAAVIESLKSELELTKSVSPAEKVAGMMPVITDQLAIKSKYVLQLKEIKPAVYMNSLINWTVLMLKSGMVREQGKAPLILVFDNLMDQFRINKYQKHGFAINSVPNAPNFVVVTNDLSMLFLKETLKIQKYDFVMVIDRMGALKSAAQSEKTLTYYLIDSPEDITDFSLDPQACIGFYKNDGSCKYFTEPSPDTALIRGDRRVARIGQNGWITEILRGLQVIENA